MIAILLACLAMVVTDILSTVRTQAEARGNAVTAGTLDVVIYLSSFLTLGVGLSTLLGHGSLFVKGLFVVLISITNFGSTWAGVKLGDRFMPHQRSMLRTVK